MKNNNGFTLIETLVVVSIFSVIGIMVTQSIALSLRGTKRSQSTVLVRDNLEYAVGIMERQIRNAKSLDCVNSDEQNLRYYDENNLYTNFSCDGNNIASGSASLTSDSVKIDTCMFGCIQGTEGVPDSVDINVTASDSNVSGVEAGRASVSTKILVRNY